MRHLVVDARENADSVSERVDSVEMNSARSSRIELAGIKSTERRRPSGSATRPTRTVYHLMRNKFTIFAFLLAAVAVGGVVTVEVLARERALQLNVTGMVCEG